MSVRIVIFLLFFVPLLVFPFGYAWFEPPKVITVQVLIEILFIANLIKKKSDLVKNLPLPLIIPILLIFLLTLIGLAFMRTETTFWGNIFRLQGVFLLWHLLLLALISSQMKLPKIPSVLPLITLLGLLASAFYFGKNDVGRVLGTLGEPNAFAASLIFLLPFLIFIQRKIFRFILLAVILWGILLSGSRAGLAAFAIQIIFLLLAKWMSLKKALIICFITLTLTFTLPLIEGGGWYENRAEIWQAGLTAGSLNPLIGGGFGNIEKLLPKGSEIANNNARFQYVDSNHNFLLDFWVQGGLIGLFSITFLLFQAFRNLALSQRKLELVGLLGVVTVMSFNPASVVTLTAFWWLIGQGFNLSRS